MIKPFTLYSSSQVSVCLWFGLPSIFPNIQWQVCFEFRHETKNGALSKHAHFVLFCPLAKAILMLFPMGPCSKTLVSMAGLFIVRGRSMVAPERGWLKFHRQSDVNLLDMQANRFDVLSVFWSCCNTGSWVIESWRSGSINLKWKAARECCFPHLLWFPQGLPCMFIACF